MSKYFLLQLKRVLRILPAIMLVAALLFGGLYLVYTGLITQWTQADVFQKVTIGMVGTADDHFLELGLTAVQTMDSSNLTVTFEAMEEQQAKTALETGQIDAYILFPPEFVDNARTGLISPLQFVSAAGSENILSLVKEELTSALDDVLLSSEQAAFGLYDVLKDLGHQDIAHGKRNELALELASLVLQRQNVSAVEEIGVADGQSFSDYMLCGILVVYLFLLTLPFVSLYVREDPAMEQNMKSRGVGSVVQVLCEIGAYFLCLLILTALTLAAMSAFSLEAVVTMMPAALAIAAISFFLCSLARDLITGVLLQFVTILALCFISGCMYPVHFFPVSVQNVAAWLPPALTRNCLAGVLSGTDCSFAAWSLLGIGIGFAGLSVLMRYVRIKAGRRANA